MTPRTRRLALPLLLAACLAACGGDEPATPPAQTRAAADGPAADAPPAAPAALDEATLREAARRALAEQRVYAPAGDNAIEHYLALRDRHPGEAGLREALVDFAPYALIAAERAIAAGDLDEGERLAAQLARIDAGAPALPRLRAAIEDARSRRDSQAAEAERRAQADAAAAAAAQARAQAAASAPAPVPPPAPGSVPAPLPAAPTPPPAPVASAPIEPVPAPAPATAPAPAPRAAPVPAPEEPRPITTPAPRYPPQAQRRRIEGEVRLMFTVGIDGSVSGVEVESATPPDVFDREAIAAVSRWRFEPLPAPVRVRRTLRFRLPDAG